MNGQSSAATRIVRFGISILWLFARPAFALSQPSSAATAAFQTYANVVESRLVQQHTSPSTFIAVSTSPPNEATDRLRKGEVITERISVSPVAEGDALLHHWRGTAFARGATAADFERLMRDFKAYPQRFAPEVEQASASPRILGQTLLRLRVRQHHVITVVLDTNYGVTFGQLDAKHGYSVSRSLRIDEIAAAGTPREHALSPDEAHGFLWRQNTYWTYEERDGGLYLQLESLSLTRAVPRGLGWAVGPYVESIPRESLEFTLRSAVNAIRK